jgi:hypothetical protein
MDDLIPAYVINTRWVGRVPSSALPHAPVVAEYRAARKTSRVRAAIATALRREEQRP